MILQRGKCGCLTINDFLRWICLTVNLTLLSIRVPRKAHLSFPTRTLMGVMGSPILVNTYPNQHRAGFPTNCLSTLTGSNETQGNVYTSFAWEFWVGWLSKPGAIVLKIVASLLNCYLVAYQFLLWPLLFREMSINAPKSVQNAPRKLRWKIRLLRLPRWSASFTKILKATR